MADLPGHARDTCCLGSPWIDDHLITPRLRTVSMTGVQFIRKAVVKRSRRWKIGIGDAVRCPRQAACAMTLAYSSVERRGSSRRAQAVHRGCGQGAHRASWSRLCNFKVQTWWPIGATRPRQRPSGLPWSWQPAVRACGGMGSRFAKSEQS